MSDINKITDVIIQENPEFGNIFKERLLKINPPIFIKNFKMFGNREGAVSLRSGIFINEPTLNINFVYMAFIILHETGHHLRYDTINYDIMSLSNLPLNKFINIVNQEEKFANEFAIKEMNQIFNKLEDAEDAKKTFDQIISSIRESNEMAIQMYHFIKSLPKENKNDSTFLKILETGSLRENQMKKQEQLIRKKIAETIKNLFEKIEVAPAKPEVKPDLKPAPAKPNPRRLTKPKIHPGADPAPKANKSQNDDVKKKLKKLQESLNNLFVKFHILTEDSPLQYSDEELGAPNPNTAKDIEQRGKNPFSKIDFLHKDVGNNQKSIEKLSDEEYKDVVNTAKKHKATQVLPPLLITKILPIQNAHKINLEQLAKNTVQQHFGIPDDVMENIFVKLTDNKNDLDMSEEDDDYDAEDLIKDFTPEEQQIIKQNVDKRTIANALMMGAGFRAHNLLDKVKPVLDAFDPDLYPAYSQLMAGGVLQFWQVDSLDNYDKKDLENFKKNMIAGKSELILGQDENGDGIREVEGAKAVAVVFPVLLHETVKACMEYIFANGLPQYAEHINREIMRQADDFKAEFWHKLLGPRLWKYLHDAIDYIVQGRNQDYTIVAYLLQEISMLPPDKFLRLMDLLIHDGAKGIVWLEKMLDRVENDLQNIDIEEEPMPQADFGNIQNLMGQIQNMLNQPGAEEKPEPEQNKPFNQMSTEELQNFILDSINSGDFEKASEARDELEKRGG